MTELWDFYFSAEMDEAKKQYCHEWGGVYIQNSVNGKPYTECTAHGGPYLNVFDDNIFVGTGTICDITQRRY